MGSGTFTLAGTGALFQIGSSTTVTAGTSTVAFTATTGNSFNRFFGGGKTYNNLTVAANKNTAFYFVTGNNTFNTVTINTPRTVAVQNGTTQSITTLTNITGSASNQVMFQSDNFQNGTGAIALTNAFTCTFCGFRDTVWSGASATATSSSQAR
jgi:hypothetical protein